MTSAARETRTFAQAALKGLARAPQDIPFAVLWTAQTAVVDLDTYERHSTPELLQAMLPGRVDNESGHPVIRYKLRGGIGNINLDPELTSQAVFVDSPGFHHSNEQQSKFSEYLRAAWDPDGADFILIEDVTTQIPGITAKGQVGVPRQAVAFALRSAPGSFIHGFLLVGLSTWHAYNASYMQYLQLVRSALVAGSAAAKLNEEETARARLVVALNRRKNEQLAAQLDSTQDELSKVNFTMNAAFDTIPAGLW